MASGAQNGNGNTSNQQQSISVLAQYIKDFSFENPNAPRSLAPQQNPPQIQLSVNVNGKPLGPTDYEVELSVEGSAGEGSDALFKFDLVYAAVLRLTGIESSNAHAVVMIEGPRLIFPFARQIVADAVRSGGFPPLMIDPIDFVALYRNRVNELQSQQPAGQA